MKDIPVDKLNKIYKDYIESMGYPSEEDLKVIDRILDEDDKRNKK